MNVRDLILPHAEAAPDAPAILAPGRPPLTYGRLLATVDEAVAGLNAAGISCGDRVAVVLPNGPEMARTFLAVAAGASIAPLNPGYREPEYRFYLEDLRAKAIVLEPGDDGPAARVAAELGLPRLELGGERTDRPPVFAAADDEALVLHTSGTTSRPKIVPLTQRNLCRSAANIAKTLALTPADRCLNVMPLFHIHGLMAATLATFATGGSLVATPGFLATGFFAWLDEFRPTWYTAVPTIHQGVLARADANRDVIERRPLRFLRSSSASLSPQVMAALSETFDAPVVEAYGMTEAAHQMTSNPLPPGPRKPGSVGPAAGPDVAVLESGEVVIRGENVTSGYEANPEANAEAFAEGWFRTGDLGRIDEDGYLFLEGRIKEIINRGGEKISPREIDEVLLDHPGVAQAVAFAIPHPTLGEEIGAAVVRADGQEFREDDLVAFAAERLADFKLPRRIVVLDEIPKGPTGKLMRIGLAERLGVTVGAGGGAGGGGPETETERTLVHLVAEMLDIPEPGRGDDFFALGGDSVLAARLIARLAEETGAELPTWIAFRRPVISDLAAEIDTRAGDREEIPRLQEGEPAPLSYPQNTVWVRERLSPGLFLNHRPTAVRLRGPLDVGALSRGLSEIVRRHETLRTGFTVSNGRPVAVPISLPETWLTPEEFGGTETELRVRLESLGRERFDLETGPLLRARLLRLDDEDHALFLGLHHIAFDGRSAALLFAELTALYEAFAAGRPSPLPAVTVPYSALAAWERRRAESGGFGPSLDYWASVLADPPAPLELPADRPRSESPGFEAGSAVLEIPADLLAGLRAVGRAEGATLFMSLWTAFQVLLRDLTGREDLLVGTYVAGRTRPEAERLIGLFVNALPIRTDLSGGPAFRELLGRVRAGMVEALTHQDVPFELLVRALKPRPVLGRLPFIDVLFQMAEAPLGRCQAAGLTWEEIGVSPRAVDLDLSVECTEGPDGVTARFEYRRELFDAATVEGWVDAYRGVLESAASESSSA